VSNILIEARCDPNCRPILDALATACGNLGHEVWRWRGPLSGRVSYSRRLGHCDLAILFNGAHHSYKKSLSQLRRRGAKLLFVELGWHPQLGTFQLDPQGINAAASWVDQPLVATACRKLPTRPGADLLVILQHDRDTQITDHSPWFADMVEFISHLCQHSQLPLRVRAHPRHPPSDRLIRLIEDRGFQLDSCQSLSQALQQCRAVACINSSAAVEALAARVPVMCYGRAIYRHAGAVYCLDDRGDCTRRVTAAIAAGESELYLESIDEVLRRIAGQQWRLEQIPARLPPVLTALLKADPASAAHRGWRWPFVLRNAG